MHKTAHFQKRMNQRGISQAMIDLVLGYGEAKDDKIVLDRQKAARLASAARSLMKIVDKGGVVVVANCDAQLTTYKFQGWSH